jgi:hypothetical protein
MNSRINELALLSGFDIDTNVSFAEKTRLKCFAELIVQDVINVLESTNEIRHIAATTYTLDVVESAIERSIDAITEHYGMKKHIRTNNERTMGRKVSSL